MVYPYFNYKMEYRVVSINYTDTYLKLQLIHQYRNYSLESSGQFHLRIFIWKLMIIVILERM